MAEPRTDPCPTCGGECRPSTVCVCGSARSYHRPEDHRDHEYQRRYFAAPEAASTPVAGSLRRWIDSLHEDANGLVWTTKAELRQMAASPDEELLDVERLARAIEDIGIARFRSSDDMELFAVKLAAALRSTETAPPKKEEA